MLAAPFTDGVVLGSAALALVLLIVARQLRGAPRWVAVSLLAITALGVAARVLIPVETQMEGPYANNRIFPLAAHVYQGLTVQLLSRSGRAFFLTDVIFKTNLAIAVTAPLLVFAHARLVLRDYRCAVAAAAILACLPLHVRFSRSDVGQIQSVAASSFSFLLLYTGLRDPSRALRAVCLALVPVVSVATYLSRPENLLFFPLDVFAIWVATDKDVPRRRTALVTALVVGAAAYAVFAHLMPVLVAAWNDTFDPGIPLQTLYLLLNPWRNTLINPWSMPPAVMALAVAGGVALYRRGERFRALFLVGWFASFFVVQSTVIAVTLVHNARYHLHFITPVVLLAAAAAPEVARLSRLRQALVAGLVLSAPLVHLGFERDVGYFELREFIFLAAMRAHVPERCTVLEFRPRWDPSGATDTSRVGRVAERVRNGSAGPAWEVVNAGEVRPGEYYESLSPAALALIANPPECLMVYEGLTCQSDRPVTEPRAPVCTALRERLALTPIARTRFTARGYEDRGVHGRLLQGEGVRAFAPGLFERAAVTLTLFRARARPAPARAP